MATLRSADGTIIEYDVAGSGPAVILTTGALDDGAENAPLATELSQWFTVYNYARRGRAGSGDTAPYALEREVEDLAALLAEAGGSAHLYGVSSGGALAFTAAAAGLDFGRLAVYEVPYLLGEKLLGFWRDYVERLEAALAADDRDAALTAFMRLAGSPEEQIAAATQAPVWPGLRRLAPTLRYDAACLGDGSPPAGLATVRQPTLVTSGGHTPYFEDAADAIVTLLPEARRLVLEGQGHVVDAKAMAPVLREFFTA